MEKRHEALKIPHVRFTPQIILNSAFDASPWHTKKYIYIVFPVLGISLGVLVIHPIIGMFAAVTSIGFIYRLYRRLGLRIMLYQKTYRGNMYQVADVYRHAHPSYRALYINNHRQGYVYHVANETPKTPSRYYRLTELFVRKKNKLHFLFLGCGPCSGPLDARRMYKNAFITVVENNPYILSLANTYFVSRETKIDIVLEDGFLYLMQTKHPPTFDCIFADMQTSYDIQPQFYNKQTYRMFFSHLSHDGILLINFLTEHEKFTKKMTPIFKDVSSIFSSAYILQDPPLGNNSILVCTKQKISMQELVRRARRFAYSRILISEGHIEKIPTIQI